MSDESIRSLRQPWKIWGKRIFGDIFPFIGFETIEASIDSIETDLPVEDGVQTVTGDFFTLEWFGYGMSFGGFRVPVKETL